MPESQAAEDQREIETLCAALRSVTDDLAELLQDGKFPTFGRSLNERETREAWWEDRVAHVRRAYAALAGVDYLSWTTRHPGLHIPPPGPVKLD